ncbi:3-ketoacyl-CoA synthase 5 [Hordeum vulgare]|nr:3-ketoacyl-CoA synthase 5 [Hordeum vulgare]
MGVRLSDMLISPSHLKHSFEIIVNNFLLLLATPTMALILLRKAVQLGPDEILSHLHGMRQVHAFLAVFSSRSFATLYLMSRPRSVYRRYSAAGLNPVAAYP